MPVLSSGFALPRAICVLRVRTARWRSRYSIRAFPDFHFYLSLQIRGGPPTRLFRHARLRNAPVRHWTHQSHPISFESPPTTPNAYHRDAQSYRTLPNSDNGCRLYPSLNFSKYSWVKVHSRVLIFISQRAIWWAARTELTFNNFSFSSSVFSSFPVVWEAESCILFCLAP